MHGRQKVQQSAEEEAKKQAERQKKLSTYQFAMSKIFKKRKNKEHDEELLGITAKVLMSNPDIATLWNIRRETLSMIKAADETKFTELVSKELELTEAGIMQNPKSYGAWFQRHWLMMETKFSLAEQEMEICNKFLKYDDRNFHCWDYRRFLVDNSPNISVDSEIVFTSEKIRTNFSNYSSWHLRSKLLPQLSHKLLEDELELIKNAAFTDPNDQSVWFYHKWLVNTHLQNVPLALTFAGHHNDEIYLIFNIGVLNPAKLKMSVSANLRTGDTVAIPDPWVNPWGKPKCKLWKMKLSDGTQSKDVVSFFISKDNGISSVPANLLDENSNISLKWGERSFQNSQEFSAFSSFLLTELQWVQELHELEPENKWAILTLIHLLRLVDFRKNEDTILQLIETLKNLDCKRLQYYLDLDKKFNLEWSIIQQLDLQPSVCSYILPPF